MTAVDEFLAWSEHDRNRSNNTLGRYRAVLDQLGDPLTATQAEVEAWWKTRLKLSPATRSNELACLRSFYKWAARFDLRMDDPTRRLDAPKIPNAVPRMIGRGDFERLLGELTDPEKTENGLVLRRAYALGGYAGLRISEAAGLDWRDVDLEQRRLYVRGKGMKERPVPLSTLMLDHLPATRKRGNVITDGGEPWDPGVLQRKVNRHLKRHGIDHTFHDLRKRGASIALSKGASPVAVRTMFGWASMETVSNYAVVGDTELDRIAEMLM